MATPNQKQQSQILNLFDDYLHAKDLRDLLTPSGDIDEQKIQQSDRLRAFQAINEEPNFNQAQGNVMQDLQGKKKTSMD